MWKIIQEVLPILLVVLLISQYIVPMLLGSKTWWLFRSETKKTEENTGEITLEKEIEETKVIVDEIKVKTDLVKTKVKKNLKTAEDLKKAADKLI